MCAFNKLKKFFLNQSDMYRFYESEYIKNQNNAKLKKELKKNNKKIKKLEKDFKKYKKNNDRIINAYNSLFNSLFIYNEVKPKRLVKLSHELTLELLDFIDNVCKKHDLQWWMYAGTLLGAVRHEGYIPWDDDLDINMLREDYEKFFKVFRKEVSGLGLSSHISITNLKCSSVRCLPFIKVEYWANDENYSFIDIFPTDYVTDVVPNLKSFHRKECLSFIEKIKAGENRQVALNEAFQNLNITREKTNILMTGVEDPIFGFVVDNDDLFPLKTLKFENRIYPCPNNYITYIKKLYGESYVRIPHTAHSHNFYEYLASNVNVYENFEESIEKMRKVNENFK